MKRRLVLTAAAMLAILAPPVSAQSSPPNVISFQGRLTDASGNPVTGDVAMTFTLYDADSGGTAVWTETRPVVSVDAGIYHVLLGEGTALDPADFDQSLWLGIAVGADPEMTPRYRLAPGAYAMRAKTADAADSATTATSFSGSIAGDVTGTQGATVVSRLQGLSLAIGSPASGQALKWNGSAWAPADDADTTYSPGDGITLAGTTFSATYAGSGGDLGSALSLARSDHVHDSRYYMESEVDTALALKADATSVYTKTEVDTALAGKLSLTGGVLSGPLAINTAGGTTGLTVSADAAVGGTLTAGSFVGDGSGLTNVSASSMTPTSRTRYATARVGDVPNNADIEIPIFVAPTGGTIRAFGFVTSEGIASAANKGTVYIMRKTGGDVVVDSVSFAATSLAAFVGYRDDTPVGGTTFVPGDVYSFKFAQGSSPMPLKGILVTIEYEYTE